MTRLQRILTEHSKWLDVKGGTRADLQGANLRNVNLQGADLPHADLQDADLRGADLQGAYLQGAKLQNADLRNANLRGAKLQNADLRNANLRGAYLQGAYLQGANLPDFNILPAGTFTAYKKVREGIVLMLEVKREHAVCSLAGRKCRASEVLVVSASAPGPYVSMHDPLFTYQIGLTAKAPLNPDPRVECTSGIHFFLTREEAKAY